MFKESLKFLYTRDLNRLKDEIGKYESDDDLWVVTGEIPNSGGNLALHLIGNLNHFLGALIGETGYVRERDKEFSDKNISRGEIIAKIEETIPVVENSLDTLSDADLEKEFPAKMFDDANTTLRILLHLFAHFNYHLGQINYHRRLTRS